MFQIRLAVATRMVAATRQQSVCVKMMVLYPVNVVLVTEVMATTVLDHVNSIMVAAIQMLIVYTRYLYFISSLYTYGHNFR